MNFYPLNITHQPLNHDIYTLLFGNHGSVHFSRYVTPDNIINLRAEILLDNHTINAYHLIPLDSICWSPHGPLLSTKRHSLLVNLRGDIIQHQPKQRGYWSPSGNYYCLYDGSIIRIFDKYNQRVTTISFSEQFRDISFHPQLVRAGLMHMFVLPDGKDDQGKHRFDSFKSSADRK